MNTLTFSTLILYYDWKALTCPVGCGQRKPELKDKKALTVILTSAVKCCE